MKRLFAAIDLPGSVAAQLMRIDPALPGVRWLRRDQLHLTLAFFGNVDVEHEEALLTRLRGVSFKPFFLPVTGIGTFPQKHGTVNVIWAGVGNGHPQLFHVHRQIQDAALGAGLEPDLRAFHPHVTLARCRNVSAGRLKPFLRQHASFEAGMFRVETCALYSSRRGPAGSVYQRELEIVAR